MRIFITGIAGCVGSTAARFFKSQGHEVSGCDSDARRVYFGPSGSVKAEITKLVSEGFQIETVDLLALRNSVLSGYDAVLHCSGQPSHDFSREEPWIDFEANASSTLRLLERMRKACPKASLVFLSTNKVYGESVNGLEYDTIGKRLIPRFFEFPREGITENCAIIPSPRTPFGASKLAADFMVQEYAHSFGMTTTVFRCGCLTGPAGAPVEKHGFLGYLVKCAVEHQPYKIYGHGGLQVRDNLAAIDLARAALLYFENPSNERVYNMGGGYENSCSILEAIDVLREMGLEVQAEEAPPRFADHKWWITDTSLFERDYPTWKPIQPLREILNEMVSSTQRR